MSYASGSLSARHPPRSIPESSDVGIHAVMESNIKNVQAAVHSLNFIQNVREQIRAREEKERMATWTAGNHDSRSFFQRMGASLAEGERALASCQQATKESSARNAQEKVDLNIIRSNVDSCKSSSLLSQRFFETDSAGSKRYNPNRPGTVTMPGFLKHLQAPAPADSKNVQEQETKQCLTVAGTAELQQQSHGLDTEHKAPALFPGEQDALQRQESDWVDSVEGFGEADEESEPKRDEMPSKALSGKSSKFDSQTEECSISDGSDDKTKEDDKPSPPILKFRAQCNFSTEFKSEERMQRERIEREAKKASEEERLRNLDGHEEKIEDVNLGWANQFFALDVATENQLHGAFPLIVLFVIDNIYPKKVRWHQVDWHASHLHAIHRNHALLEKIWNEVNMDKLREFRLDPITARIENAVTATCADKLQFLKTLKRWFEGRVRYSEQYDPILRRTEIEKAVLVKGRYVRFPAWMKYDQESINHSRRRTVRKAKFEKKLTMTASDWDDMPEFKRLTLFLGSADHQRL